MADALTNSIAGKPCAGALLLLAALAFTAIGAALNDTFYLRLATEALIFAGSRSRSTSCSAIPASSRSARRSISARCLYIRRGPDADAFVLAGARPRSLAGLVLGLIGGIIAIRVRGVYFALITFGMAQVVAKVIYNTRALGASDGMMGVPVIDIDLGVVRFRARRPRAFSWSCWQ